MEFIKNVKKLLPYDREQYIKFLCDDSEPSVEWYGVSFQLYSEREKIAPSEHIKIYERLFKNIVLKLDDGSFWTVNHDDKDMAWFPNDENNLIRLRTLFKQKNISNAFKGAIHFKKEKLLAFSQDLISYPYAVFSKEGALYKNLDISHSKLQFVMKISGHMNIDILSTNKELLKEVTNQNKSNTFHVKEYNGTTLVID